MAGGLRSAIQTAIRIGVLGGVVAWHVSLVGMVETFAERRIIGQAITLGYALLVGMVLVVGYVAAQRTQRPGRALLTGAVAGTVVGLALLVLALLIAWLNPRTILIYASPRLVNILTVGRGLGIGLLFPVIGGLVTGTLGGGLAAAPVRWRRMISAAILATILLGLLRDVISVLLPTALSRRFFTSTGLTPFGATVSLILAGALVGAITLYRLPESQSRLGSAGNRLPQVWRLAFIVLAAVLLLSFPLWARVFLSNVADFVGLYIIMGLGLNLVVGFAGLLDLGYVAFYAIGAYTLAVLTSPEIGVFQMTFWQALPLAMLASMLGGVLLGLPVLRMRGDYLAIATLGFGEIIRILVLSDFLKPYLGGAQGVTRIGQPVIGDFVMNNPERIYYLILAGCVLAWFIATRLKTSRLGRAWMAIREDEDVAQAMGINRVTAKLTAFAIGAFLGGLAGAAFASMVGSVVPRSFELLVSINVLSLIIIGGMGSLPGVIVGALALVGLPELLREFREYRLLVYGAVLVLMMLFRPEGLWPETTRARELHEAEEEPMVEEVPAAVSAATPPRQESARPHG